MKLLINQRIYSVKDVGLFGGEGDVYLIPNDREKCVKVLYPDGRNYHAERKILAIINKFSQIRFLPKELHFGIPEVPVYLPENRFFCGYRMTYFSNHHSLSRYKYSVDNKNFPLFQSEEIAFSVVKQMFGMLQFLHEFGIIYGDFSPQNILLNKNTFQPVFIDMDSVQLATYFSKSRCDEYAYPKVSTKGYGNKRHYVYSTSSDVYALAVVSFELIIGVNPFFFQTTPASFTPNKKHRGLSILHYYVNHFHPDKQLYKLYENSLSEAVFDRLKDVEKTFPNLLEFFKDVFIHRNLGLKNISFDVEALKYTINQKNKLAMSKFTPLVLEQKDPVELQMFMHQYNLKIV